MHPFGMFWGFFWRILAVQVPFLAFFGHFRPFSDRWPSLALFWPVLGPFWSILVYFGLFWPFRVPFLAFFGHFRPLYRVFEVRRAVSEPSRGRFGLFLADRWPSLALFSLFWALFGLFWSILACFGLLRCLFWPFFGHFRPLYRVF